MFRISAGWLPALCNRMTTVQTARHYAHQALRLCGILPETRTHGLTVQRTHADRFYGGNIKASARCRTVQVLGFAVALAGIDNAAGGAGSAEAVVDIGHSNAAGAGGEHAKQGG